MNSSALKQLRIEHLRGSVSPFTLTFEKGKNLTVIYGENGTGKTTICDALDFLGNGKVGSLDNRGLGKTHPYWHSVGKAASDVDVKLDTASGISTGRVNKGSVVVEPPESKPLVEVLRRSQILSLIEARPGERYEAIQRFIDVTGVEQSEATLRELIRSLNNGRETAVARVQENEDTIQQFWETAGKPHKDPLTWTAKEAVRDLSNVASELESVRNLRTAYERLELYPEKLKTIEDELDTERRSTLEADQQLNQLLTDVAEGASELIDLFQSALSYLDKNPQPQHCPLCDSQENVSGLKDRVKARIDQYSTLTAAKKQKRLYDKKVQSEVKRLDDLKSSFSNDRKNFDGLVQSKDWSELVKLPATNCPEDLAELGAWLGNAGDVSGKCVQIETALQDQSQFFSTLKQAFRTYQENVEEQKKLDKILPRLERTLEIVIQTRKEFTDQVLSQIAGKVGELYENVHPGEGLNKISLELDPNKRSSLEIGTDFAGANNTPPQAYFSQSHLDTLGICVFLALASMDSPDETILVLDDVLASVDEPHVDRLIEMLYDEATQFRHCVITTHYRPWKQKLRWGWLQNGQCYFVELTKWSETSGLSVIRSTPDIPRLRELLAEVPPDPQLVCAKAGVILEAALDFITQLYECEIPRRQNALYTLGDLLQAIKKPLRQRLRIKILKGTSEAGEPEYAEIMLGPILDELTRITQARNVFGAHFNDLSFDLLESDAIGFAEQVLALIDALVDTEKGWPRNSKSGEYWSTAGETRRLHPLKKPG